MTAEGEVLDLLERCAVELEEALAECRDIGDPEGEALLREAAREVSRAARRKVAQALAIRAGMG